ncbi:MAG: DUF4465 domain-containing protein [Pirellulales bacterium]
MFHITKTLLIPIVLQYAFIMLAQFASAGIVTTNFEEMTFPNGQSFDNGSSGHGPFTSGPDILNQVTFNNSYSTIVFNGVTYESWYGFSSSKVIDSTTGGFGNQYASFSPVLPGIGAGSGGSSNYLVAYYDSFVGAASGGAYFNLPASAKAVSVDLANTTYSALYIRDGNSSPFTNLPYGPGDYFDVILTGYSASDATGSVTGSTRLRLADYTSNQSIVLSGWTTLDLTGLGSAQSVGISFDTTDVDPFLGINTPTYVALDNLRFDSSLSAVPEPSTVLTLSITSGLLLYYRRKRRKTSSNIPSQNEPAA